ncbi:MAG: PAS domain S-box protein [Vannielia sp.]|uniref:sensor histidine kinase n=1 Tax=Vannielia sp. TaxID=2813045 RepID=UPI003B8B6E48
MKRASPDGTGAAHALAGRITLIAVGMVLTVSLLYGSYHVLTTRSAALRAAESDLQQRASFYAGQISAVFRSVEDQSATVSRHPPIAGIARALPTGIDPLDGSTLDHWKSRLAVIMANTIEVQPHFTQIRLILADDGWHEIVRVDQRGGKPVRVSESELQRKGAEPYLTRARTDPATAPYFSAITYNREHGKRDGGPVTIRYIQPVRDVAGQLYAVLVFNADYEQLLQAARPEVLKNQTVAVVNSAGDYLLFEPDGKTSRLHHHTDADYRPLPEVEALGSQLGTQTFAHLDDDLIYLSTVPIDPSRQIPAQFGVLTFGTRDLLDANIAGVLVRHLLLTILLVGFAGVVTHLLASEMATRFERLTHEVDRSHARLGWTLRNVADGLITISGDGRIEEINPAAEDMFGYSAAELAGQPLTRLMFDQDATEHPARVAASGIGAQSIRMAGNREIFGRHKSGLKVPLEISVTRAELDGEVKFIGMVRDITERHAAENRMAELVGQLRRSNEELDQFAYVASHDLKAPLRVIQNAAGWLADDLAPYLDDDTRESLDLLQSRATRMEHLLNDLLEHSRIGRREHSVEQVGGAEFLDNLKGLLNVPPGMHFETVGPFATATLPLMPLQVVLLNLVSNAFKHHDRPEGRVRLGFTETPAAWHFTVEDDGPGIAPEFHERVFQIFQTLRPRDEIEGSGMGLAMVRKHVEVAGGRIELHSDGTRGTTFRLTWPRPAATPPQEIAA